MSEFAAARLDAGPPGEGRHALAAFAHGALRAAVGRIARVREHVLPGAVVRRPEHIGGLVEAERAELVHDVTDARVILDDGIAELRLDRRLSLVLRRRKVRLVHLHEVDAHEEGLRRMGMLVEIIERRLLDIFVEERDADHALLGRVHILAVDLEVLMRRLARVAGERALGHLIEHRPKLGIHVREPGRVPVGVGVEVIEADVFHHVVALRGGERIVGLAEMPLAGEERVVAARLEHGSERPFRRRKAAALALEGHGGHAAAVRDAARLHRGASRRAGGLSVEGQKLHALDRDAVEVRRRGAAIVAAAIGAHVAVAEVVRDDQQDVGLGRLRHGRRRRERRGGHEKSCQDMSGQPTGQFSLLC